MVRERERKRRDLNHLSVHHWLRSAIRDSQQPISPIGFLFLKLPPPPCAVLLVYIYIYRYRTTVATSCDLNAPRCTTEVLRVRFHGSRGGVFVGHRPPGTPVTPRDIYKKEEVWQKFFTYSDVTHTHTFFLELTLMVGSAGLFELRFHRRVGLKAIASFWGPASGIYSLFMFFFEHIHGTFVGNPLFSPGANGGCLFPEAPAKGFS